MAQQIGGRQLIRPAPKRKQLLAEATAAGAAAREILTHRFGAAAWIDQAVAAVQNAVQLSIEQLSGSTINGNARPSDPYRFHARTAQELKESAHLVPGANPADLPPPDDGPEPPRVEPRLPPPKAAGGGWLL